MKPLVRRLRYRVYQAKHPTDVDGRPYTGSYPKECGWYWVRHGCGLPIRVYGLKQARWVASTLDKANAPAEARVLPSPQVVCWTCRICGRTGFDKPTAHGCLNKPKDWKKSNVAVSGPAVAGTLHRPCSAQHGGGNDE